MTIGDWLELWERMGARGYFANETDFPAALARLREEVAAFGPDREDWTWQDVKSWFWIAEMSTRIGRGLPPVTGEEYATLASWYFRHEHNPEIYDVNLRVYLADRSPRGVGRPGVTGLVAKLRRLRRRFPELE
jgi:hypothetical protein